jgi:hypothetical protein
MKSNYLFLIKQSLLLFLFNNFHGGFHFFLSDHYDLEYFPDTKYAPLVDDTLGITIIYVIDVIILSIYTLPILITFYLNNFFQNFFPTKKTLILLLNYSFISLLCIFIFKTQSYIKDKLKFK